jgi:hypothetical protein
LHTEDFGGRSKKLDPAITPNEINLDECMNQGKNIFFYAGKPLTVVRGLDVEAN